MTTITTKIDSLGPDGEGLKKTEATDLLIDRRIHGITKPVLAPTPFNGSHLTHYSKAIYALDLAGHRPPLKPKCDDDLVQAKPSSLSPHTLYAPFLDHSSEKFEITPLPAESVQSKIKDFVESFSCKVDYNSLNIAEEFVRFSQKKRASDPKISESSIFLDFQTTPSREVLETHGSACAGQSLEIKNALFKTYGLPAYLLVERNSSRSSPHHTLVGIFCKDGIVLIDPTLFAQGEKTVVIKSKEQAKNKSIYGSPTTFDLDLSSKIIKKTQNTPKGQLDSEILLSPLRNPEQCVMKPFMLSRPWYAITGSDSSGKVVSVIRVDIGKKRLIFQKGTGSLAKKLVLPFESFNTKKLAFNLAGVDKTDQELFFREDFWGYFKIHPKLLLEKIATLIENELVIQNLFTQTRAPNLEAPTS